MEDEPLGDAWEKLRWARHHFEILFPEIQAFEKGAHTFSVEVNEDAGEYVFRVHDLRKPEPDWALALGDCIHNARAALDCLIAELYALAAGEDARKIDWLQFPLVSKPKHFLGAMGIARAKKRLEFSGYLTRIEELQPYNASNPSIWGSAPEGGLPSTLPGVLKELSDLDNIDKHRVVHTLWTGLEFFQGLMPDPPPWPAEFQQLPGLMSGDALENDAEVGRWRFQTPLPRRWKPTQMDMKRCLPLQVSLDVGFILKGVLEVLPVFLRAVGAVLELFEPVLVRRAAPLPIGEIRWPPNTEDRS